MDARSAQTAATAGRAAVTKALIEGLIRILKRLGYPATPMKGEAVEEELLKFSNAIRLDDDVTFIEVRLH